MRNANPVLTTRLSPDEMARAFPWQASRPVLVYDPGYQPAAATRLRTGVGGVLLRTPVIWLGAAMLAAAVGGTSALVNPAAFSATGLLLGLGRDPSAAQDELAMIRSDEVMRGVVSRLGVARVAPGCAADRLTGPGCAMAAAKAAVQVRIVGDSNDAGGGPMLRLTVTHDDAAVAVAMVDAVVAADRAIWYLARPADQQGALDGQLTTAQASLDAIQDGIAQIRDQAQIGSIDQDMARAVSDSARIAQQDNDILLRQAASGAELQAARAALQTEPATVLDSREVSSGAAGAENQAMLLQLQLQRAHMAKLYARDYPGLAELDAKIDAIETAIKTQAKNSASVIRDIRNPVLALLSAKVAVLTSELAGLAQQRVELQRQAGVAGSRVAVLRQAEASLAGLQQRQIAQAAVVRQLTLGAANLRAQDALSTERLAQRRLLQRPVAEAALWTGWPVALAAGGGAGLLYGLGLTLLRRRRAIRAVLQVSRRALERLERVWTPPAPAALPQIEAPPPPSLALDPPPAPEAEAKRVLRMFAARRERDIKTLGFECQESPSAARHA